MRAFPEGRSGGSRSECSSTTVVLWGFQGGQPLALRSRPLVQRPQSLVRRTAIAAKPPSATHQPL